MITNLVRMAIRQLMEEDGEAQRRSDSRMTSGGEDEVAER